MLKKDKEKVLDEVWTEERVRGFLDIQAPAGENIDFHALLSAYRSMRLENFEQFLDFFVEAKRDLTAQGQSGETVLQVLAKHRHATPYAEALQSHIN